MQFYLYSQVYIVRLCPKKQTPVETSVLKKLGRKASTALRAVFVVLVVLGAERFMFTKSTLFTFEQAENVSLQAKIADLESAGIKACQSKVDLRMPNDSCPGSDLVDTCWFKVGILMLKCYLVYYSILGIFSTCW